MNEDLSQRAYSHIIEKLSSGELPPGSRLSNRGLASEIGVSVIPVREAIRRLGSEGFVEHQPGVGSFVPTPSYEQLMDIYDLREAVECHAAKKAATMPTERLVVELAGYLDVWGRIVATLDRTGGVHRNPKLLSQWSETDASFHDAIVAASGNRQALETCRRLRKMARIFGTRLECQPLVMLRRSLESHGRIVDALQRGDGEAAAGLLTEHIQHGCRQVLGLHHSSRTERPSTPQSPSTSGRGPG